MIVLTGIAGPLTEAICAATGLTPQDVAVSVGRRDDRSTWRVSAIPDEHRKTAEAVLASFEPPVERRLVPKSLVIARLTDAQLEAALALMTPRQRERWRASDKPAVFADDPETVALLAAIGADAETILAP